MALKLYVKLQTPTIELKVAVKDVAGSKDNISVGFKRYEIAPAQVKLERMKEIFDITKDDEVAGSKLLDDFVTAEIVYIKGASLSLEDNGSAKELNISDTRTAKPIADLWDNGDECLAVLTSMYLSSTPYRLALVWPHRKHCIIMISWKQK